MTIKRQGVCLEAEREFLRSLDGSCNAPCGAHCIISRENFEFRGMYAADGENPKYAKIKERREAAGVNINDDDLKQAISLAGKLVNILKQMMIAQIKIMIQKKSLTRSERGKFRL